MTTTYQFRHLPCNIVPENRVWCVSGAYGSAGGVLEWCYDRADAERIAEELKKDPDASEIRAHKWITTPPPSKRPGRYRYKVVVSEYEYIWAVSVRVPSVQAAKAAFILAFPEAPKPTDGDVINVDTQRYPLRDKWVDGEVYYSGGYTYVY